MESSDRTKSKWPKRLLIVPVVLVTICFNKAQSQTEPLSSALGFTVVHDSVRLSIESDGHYNLYLTVTYSFSTQFGILDSVIIWRDGDRSRFEDFPDHGRSPFRRIYSLGLTGHTYFPLKRPDSLIVTYEFRGRILNPSSKPMPFVVRVDDTGPIVHLPPPPIDDYSSPHTYDSAVVGPFTIKGVVQPPDSEGNGTAVVIEKDGHILRRYPNVDFVPHWNEFTIDSSGSDPTKRLVIEQWSGGVHCCGTTITVWLTDTLPFPEQSEEEDISGYAWVRKLDRDDDDREIEPTGDGDYSVGAIRLNVPIDSVLPNLPRPISIRVEIEPQTAGIYKINGKDTVVPPDKYKVYEFDSLEIQTDENGTIFCFSVSAHKMLTPRDVGVGDSTSEILRRYGKGGSEENCVDCPGHGDFDAIAYCETNSTSGLTFCCKGGVVVRIVVGRCARL